MTTALLFDFSVDKEKNSITVNREFNAGINLVWAAWTAPELLDEWWAPKPYKTRTKSMDFREGGTWLYAMTGPTGDTHWCRADYKKIELQKNISWTDSFCDSNGVVTKEFPGAHWTNTFSESGGTTIVNIVIKYKNLEDLEGVIQIGFKEGFTAAMTNLDHYIETQFKMRNELRTGNNARVCSYLNFPGNTEEAFVFYKKVFRSEFSGKGLQRFGDLPADSNHPPVADAVKKMIIHVELPITGNHILMGTDAPEEMGFTVTQGNNMYISLEPETREETKRIFDELSAGGNITMQLQDMFWGAYFGSFTDKYGINWMVNFKNGDK